MEHPIREFRKENGISIDQGAKALNVAKSSLSRIENGKQPISSKLMERIKEWTGGKVTPNDLVEYKPPQAAA